MLVFRNSSLFLKPCCLARDAAEAIRFLQNNMDNLVFTSSRPPDKLNTFKNTFSAQLRRLMLRLPHPPSLSRFVPLHSLNQLCTEQAVSRTLVIVLPGSRGRKRTCRTLRDCTVILFNVHGRTFFIVDVLVRMHIKCRVTRHVQFVIPVVFIHLCDAPTDSLICLLQLISKLFVLHNFRFNSRTVNV